MNLNLEDERTVVIPGIDWETFVQMDELLQDSPVRMKFCDQYLEIMSPISRRHEHIKGRIGCMIELFCRKHGIDFNKEGSATLRKEGSRSGEPDESYIFTPGVEKAELVIESALTSGGIDKLEFYAPLEIPEVWIWQNGELAVYHFENGGYNRASESRLLPRIDIALIGSLADGPGTTGRILNRFEEAVKQ